MLTTQRLREHLETIPDDQMFSTQELLFCGRRNALDLALSKMVRQNKIVRVARGLFIKKLDNLNKLNIADVARAKAKAFGKRISLHANYAALKIGLVSFDEIREPLDEILVYTSGCSSSFMFNGFRIRLVAASSKKLDLPDSYSGNTLKAAWHFCRQPKRRLPNGLEEKKIRVLDSFSYSYGVGYSRDYHFYQCIEKNGQNYWFRINDPKDAVESAEESPNTTYSGYITGTGREFISSIIKRSFRLQFNEAFRRNPTNRDQYNCKIFSTVHVRNFRPKTAYLRGKPNRMDTYKQSKSFRLLARQMPQWLSQFFYR